MSVTNGQAASATTFNNAFVSKDTDSTMESVLTLDAPSSGAIVTNTQQAINNNSDAISNHLADTSDAHDASAISFTPGGSIVATDVQAAISEVASDADSALSSHLSDASDAHDASAISFVPTGSVVATDVQAAIAEVASEAGDFKADGSVPMTGDFDGGANNILNTGRVAVNYPTTINNNFKILIHGGTDANMGLGTGGAISGAAVWHVVNDANSANTPLEFRASTSYFTTGGIDLQGYGIANVLDPVNAQDAATKNYVDTMGGGANTSLSNLAATAVNADIKPSGTNVHSVGTTTNQFLGINGQYIYANDSATKYIGIWSDGTSNLDSGGDMLITAYDQGAGAPKIVIDAGGNTTPGKIALRNGANTTVGYIWTATNVNGEGDWQPASGGGGGSIQWIEDSNAPIATIENKIRVYQFQSALAQELHTIVKVPNSYTAGNQVRLRMFWYSNDTSGTALIQSVSTLIRAGVDAITSTANQRTSTNAAVTMSGVTQNIPQALTLDLSSASGQINGVSIAAGDLIVVKITRGTDTGASDISVPVNCAEVTFT